VEDPVSDIGISLIVSSFPLHGRPVALQEIDVVAHHQKLGEGDVVLPGLRQCVLGFG
jgi:hypothetical protein